MKYNKRRVSNGILADLQSWCENLFTRSGDPSFEKGTFLNFSVLLDMGLQLPYVSQTAIDTSGGREHRQILRLAGSSSRCAKVTRLCRFMEWVRSWSIGF